ncbi:hypothetical protein [Streptomyces sp. NPDC003327]
MQTIRGFAATSRLDEALSAGRNIAGDPRFPKPGILQIIKVFAMSALGGGALRANPAERTRMVSQTGYQSEH